MDTAGDELSRAEQVGTSQSDSTLEPLGIPQSQTRASCAGAAAAASPSPSTAAKKVRAFLLKYFWDGQKLDPRFAQSSLNAGDAASSTESWTENESPLSSPCDVAAGDGGGERTALDLDGAASDEGVDDDEGRRCNWRPTKPSAFVFRHRKWFAVLLPATLVHAIWWTIMIANDYFYKFTEPSGSLGKPRYLMSITMIFGSMVAGATSEGGGAVAFPVMTLALGIAPAVARDFSFMIQSVGMVAASFAILVMRVAVEWKALVHVTIGGAVGIILGLEQVAPRLTPPYSKMYFVVIWSSFAVGLYMLNRNHGRVVYDQIPCWEQGIIWKTPENAFGQLRLVVNWKQMALFSFGFLGGIFSSMAGSGIDICSFAALTLLFRVDEKVATPTSVILMGINTCVGFAYRELKMGGVEEDAWGFLLVCAPIVVIGAPIGSFLGTHFHRLTLAAVIYVIDAAQLVGALYVVRPWTTEKTDTPLHLSLTSLALFFSGMIFFRMLSRVGLKLIGQNEKYEKIRSVANMEAQSE